MIAIKLHHLVKRLGLYVELASKYIQLLRRGYHQLCIVHILVRLIAVRTSIIGITNVIRNGLSHKHYTIKVIVTLAYILHHLHGFVHTLREHHVLTLQPRVLLA